MHFRSHLPVRKSEMREELDLKISQARVRYQSRAFREAYGVAVCHLAGCLRGCGREPSGREEHVRRPGHLGHIALVG
jgi:hypothetical protein